jgi:hypothetical protein
MPCQRDAFRLAHDTCLLAPAQFEVAESALPRAHDEFTSTQGDHLRGTVRAAQTLAALDGQWDRRTTMPHGATLRAPGSGSTSPAQKNDCPMIAIRS